jgi:EAL domain-containing protein (putative c-di-GMP-specific phosphodiesterase class I)
MVYQPIVCWSKRSVFAYEGLVRSAEPALPNPGAFLTAAERLHRLDEVGRAIRGRVAGAMIEDRVHTVFVNLHTRDLLDEALYNPESPLSQVARRVVLEITERAALDEVRDVRDRVARLRKMGYRVAVDDLGAGYAGLTSFAQLEPDVVKLDMSLVRNVNKEPTKLKLIRSMISLCAEMGLLVVAEGVETSEERDVLVDLGCDYLQGYLFARPGSPFPEVVW